ncbi:hypothetical protein B0O99DRAFT_680979 [Bisporella sp. PMI_857]|nr:hypothetical protein B0O99DRAFT_680979 [Bisporella sp. PMI_857]
MAATWGSYFWKAKPAEAPVKEVIPEPVDVTQKFTIKPITSSQYETKSTSSMNLVPEFIPTPLAPAQSTVHQRSQSEAITLEISDKVRPPARAASNASKIAKLFGAPVPELKLGPAAAATAPQFPKFGKAAAIEKGLEPVREVFKAPKHLPPPSPRLERPINLRDAVKAVTTQTKLTRLVDEAIVAEEERRMAEFERRNEQIRKEKEEMDIARNKMEIEQAAMQAEMDRWAAEEEEMLEYMKAVGIKVSSVLPQAENSGREKNSKQELDEKARKRKEREAAEEELRLEEERYLREQAARDRLSSNPSNYDDGRSQGDDEAPGLESDLSEYEDEEVDVDDIMSMYGGKRHTRVLPSKNEYRISNYVDDEEVERINAKAEYEAELLRYKMEEENKRLEYEREQIEERRRRHEEATQRKFEEQREQERARVQREREEKERRLVEKQQQRAEEQRAYEAAERERREQEEQQKRMIEEEAREAEERRQRRIEGERLAARRRQEEEERFAEQRRLDEQARRDEEARALEEQRRLEEEREEEARRFVEEEEQRYADDQRRALEARNAEQALYWQQRRRDAEEAQVSRQNAALQAAEAAVDERIEKEKEMQKAEEKIRKAFAAMAAAKGGVQMPTPAAPRPLSKETPPPPAKQNNLKARPSIKGGLPMGPRGGGLPGGPRSGTFPPAPPPKRQDSFSTPAPSEQSTLKKAFPSTVRDGPSMQAPARQNTLKKSPPSSPATSMAPEAPLPERQPPRRLPIGLPNGPRGGVGLPSGPRPRRREGSADGGLI